MNSVSKPSRKDYEPRPAGKEHYGYHGITKQLCSEPVPMYAAGVAPMKPDTFAPFKQIDYARAVYAPGIGVYPDAAQLAEHAAICKAWEGIISLPQDLYPEPVKIK